MRKSCPWTQQEDNELAQLLAENKSIVSIAETLGRTVDAISWRIRTRNKDEATGKAYTPQIMGPELFDDEREWRQFLSGETLESLLNFHRRKLGV